MGGKYEIRAFANGEIDVAYHVYTNNWFKMKKHIHYAKKHYDEVFLIVRRKIK